MSTPWFGRRAQQRTLACVTACVTAGVVAAGTLAFGPGATAADDADAQAETAAPTSLDAGRYVVLLKEESATRYDGGTGDFAATKKQGKEPFNARRESVREYSQHLRTKQDRLARSVGARVGRHYTLATNAFSTDLTGKQATTLSNSKQVLLLTEDTAYDLDTWNTPDFLGLAGRDGVWNQHGRARRAGAGVVIGVLDTGIWPESQSFDGDRLTAKPRGRWDVARNGNTITMEKADGGVFTGFCEPGESWAPTHCSSKLVGARYYPETFLEAVPEEDRSPTEYISTRDGGGHGSHTAGTAGGNNGVDVTVEDTTFGEVSGMAPASAIAAYKVCFADNDPNTGGCYTSSTLAAVEDAITDGVDVINYSISGATSTVVDAVEFAFEGAAEAGVFVAASAGNSGPRAESVAHNSPWLTTVAASTHTSFENTVVLGDGTRVKGASIASDPLASKPLVESTASKKAEATANDAKLCVPGSLDPAKVSGTIVLCTRGVIDRVAKSRAVAEAGGAGMVLANESPGSLDADLHTVPSVHISNVDRPTVLDYIASAGAGATASFEKGDTTGGEPTPVPQMAPFSSRGPARASDSDLLKPDITGPGVSVLAAVAPPSNSNRDYDLYSGTSMSSPHVAGLAAFMLGVHPDWTPMMVKSAMMTTAYDVKDSTGGKLTDPFAQGAGHVDPTKFFNPGLVVTSDAAQWRGFLQAQGLDLGVEPLAASDLNGPSIAQGEVTSETTLTRTFTALQKGTWDVSVDLPGFDAKHANRVRTKRVGDREALSIRFTRTTAPLGKFATGFLTLSGPTKVRLPIALRPVSVKAPGRADGTGASGSVAVPITSGFTGDLAIEPTGLAKAVTEQGDLAVGESSTQRFTVAPNTRLLRADLDATNDQADLDLYLYRLNAAGQPVALAGRSASGAADESITVKNPPAADYLLLVDGYSAAPGEDSIAYRSDVFRVDPSATAGNLTATPNPLPVVTGVETSYDAGWSGLETNSRYLGYFEYEGALAPTYLYVTS